MMSSIAFLLLVLTWCLLAPTVDASMPLSTTAASLVSFRLANSGTADTFAIDGPALLSTNAEAAEFGATIDWNANYELLAVGAPHYGDTNQGAVFVYDASTFELLWSLVGDDLENIGGRLSLSAKMIAIGRRNSIQVYDAYTGELMAGNESSATIASQRGNDVTLIKDEMLVVGEDRADSRTGQARFLSYNQETGEWIEVVKIPGLFKECLFGWMVATSDDGSRLAISAPNADNGLYRQGYVLVFDRVDSTGGTWEQVGHILYGTVEGAQFGFSLAMSGDGNTIVIGSPGTVEGGVSVFSYDHEGSFVQVGAPIYATESGDRFGRSVAVSYTGTRIAATSFFFDRQRGHARVFDLIDNDEWFPAYDVEGDKVMNRLGFGNFGLGISPDGSMLTVGAVWASATDDAEGEQLGRVHIIDLETYNKGADETLSPSPTTPLSDLTHTSSPAPSLAPSTNLGADLLPSVTDDGTVTIYGPPSVSFEDEQEFGSVVDYNQNGDLLAVGAPGYGSTKQGAVFVYDATSYKLLWSAVGDTVNEVIGSRLSLSNGKIAIGRRNSIEIYDAYTGALVGESIPSLQGNDITLVNDELLIIGEDRYDTRTGQARILSYNQESGEWDVVLTIPGFFSEGRFGWIVTASTDGSRVAISAPNAERDSYRQGYVAIVERNGMDGSWDQLGDILFGAAESGQFGFSLAISGDGNTIVAGSQGMSDGAVAAFRLAEGSWQQVGTTIHSKAAGQRFGRSVAISHDGTRLVATSNLFDNERGRARVFDLVDTDWSYVHEVEGDNTMDRLGSGIHGLHLSSDGSILTVGAVWAIKSGVDRTGEVKVINLEAVVEERGALAPTNSPTNDAITGSPSAPLTPTLMLSPSANYTAIPTVTSSLFPSGSPSASPSTESSQSESLVPSSLRGSFLLPETPSIEPSRSNAPSGDESDAVVISVRQNGDGFSGAASMWTVTTTSLISITILLGLLL